jgi:hypothetical protein
MCVANIYMTRHDTKATVLTSLSGEEQAKEARKNRQAAPNE